MPDQKNPHEAWGDRANVDLGWNDPGMRHDGGPNFLERGYIVYGPVAVAAIVAFWLGSLGIKL